ncbi:hypothetical protein [Streptomyces chiangmaiensis]|uniref:Uncharacterized protein n=1 Tax=Streptomyces chiangmaiensis TaxID=766497 RepID=A0ABU7FWV9_9ACTN|nr:hypothetical protein [Streptomyces chiangmaiensis]MED7828621.1 hypothetical protein [Streptomyces chiangmaiensis]
MSRTAETPGRAPSAGTAQQREALGLPDPDDAPDATSLTLARWTDASHGNPGAHRRADGELDEAVARAQDGDETAFAIAYPLGPVTH